MTYTNLPGYPAYVPILAQADSALWLFEQHTCAADPLPHSVFDCATKIGKWSRLVKPIGIYKSFGNGDY